MKKRLLIFDFDGTLVDTAPDIVNAFNEFLQEMGFPQLPATVITRHIGNGLKGLIQSLLQQNKINTSSEEQLTQQLYAIYENHFLKCPQPLKDSDAFLKSCTHQLAIVSNKPQAFIHPILKKFHWDVLPWVLIIGGDTLAKKKPDPLPLREVIKKAGASLIDCFMIGDGLLDIKAAQAAEITSVAVNFGYTTATSLKDAGAQFQIDAFKDLEDLIELFEIT